MHKHEIHNLAQDLHKRTTSEVAEALALLVMALVPKEVDESWPLEVADNPANRHSGFWSPLIGQPARKLHADGDGLWTVLIRQLNGRDEVCEGVLGSRFSSKQSLH